MKFTAYHHRKRFPEWRDPPTVCDCCGYELVVLTGNEWVYGRPVGDWPWFYVCLGCEALVGCHPHSIYPLGVLADKATRQMRRQLHAMIDVHWSTPEGRTTLYKRLAALVGTSTFHIGNLSKAQCLEVNEVFRTWEAIW